MKGAVDGSGEERETGMGDVFVAFQWEVGSKDVSTSKQLYSYGMCIDLR